MAVLTVATPTVDGANPGFVAAGAGGDSFPNTGHELLLVENAGAETTVTIDAPGACDFGLSANAAHDEGGTVPATTGRRVFGPFVPIRKFNDTNGRVQVTYSSVASVTVAVVSGNA